MTSHKLLQIIGVLYVGAILALSVVKDRPVWLWALAIAVAAAFAGIALFQELATGPDRVPLKGTWFGVKK